MLLNHTEYIPVYLKIVEILIREKRRLLEDLLKTNCQIGGKSVQSTKSTVIKRLQIRIYRDVVSKTIGILASLLVTLSVHYYITVFSKQTYETTLGWESEQTEDWSAYDKRRKYHNFHV